jgi:hypothetical protein
MNRDPWTVYKCAKLPSGGRLATDGNVARLRVADNVKGEFIDISIDIPLPIFREVLAAARLICISELNANNVTVERNDNLEYQT